jgi:hypothetical protein
MEINEKQKDYILMDTADTSFSRQAPDTNETKPQRPPSRCSTGNDDLTSKMETKRSQFFYDTHSQNK